MSTLGRRAFLVVASLLSPLASLRGVAQRSELAAFLALSSRLTGRKNLDPAAGSAYLNALVVPPQNRLLLDDLARGGPGSRTAAHTALEQEILGAWYTGAYFVGGERRVATHAGALMWTVLGRPAPGLCAGPAGSWSTPPPAVKQ
jgi:Membrane bound FAD containing D-sorbitol dehydrogenase